MHDLVFINVNEDGVSYGFHSTLEEAAQIEEALRRFQPLERGKMSAELETFQCANCWGHIFVAEIDPEYGVIYSHDEDTGCDDPEIETEENCD